MRRQVETLASGRTHFLITGDVYRRDSIDATHYPVFHQMEGVAVFSEADWAATGKDATTHAADELKSALEGLARHLFGDVQARTAACTGVPLTRRGTRTRCAPVVLTRQRPGAQVRWVDAYFPFTEPSFEMEIFFNGQWLEVLGCGVMQQSILEGAAPGGAGKRAWAFGLGLERLAMVLFGIPDIRLFWSTDPRFTKQFAPGCFRAGGACPKFASYSKYPPCYKDIAFWLPPAGFTENNLCEMVRGVAGDLAEEVKLIDSFDNKKNGKTSHCYRITYRSMERSLTDEEINKLQEQVRAEAAAKLHVELR